MAETGNAQKYMVQDFPQFQGISQLFDRSSRTALLVLKLLNQTAHFAIISIRSLSDEHGFPYYKGGTFKGIFREELRNYLSWTMTEADKIDYH